MMPPASSSIEHASIAPRYIASSMKIRWQKKEA
jgi:hypothetical protein